MGSVDLYFFILAVIVFLRQIVDGTASNPASSSLRVKMLDQDNDPPPYVKPSSYPTLLPSSNPTQSRPTNLPTLLPSSHPSKAMPTNHPSLLPTSIPSHSHQPTAHSTDLPTNLPSVYVKTDFPTNLPSSSFPSSIPSTAPAVPSSQPSSFPSISPSNQPTSHPTRHTNHPSMHPTASPSSAPTVIPSAAPTPEGEAGKDWWYTLSSEITLTSFVSDTFSADDQQAIMDSLNYAFLTEYSESLTVSESESITIVVNSLQNYQKSSLLRKASPPSTYSRFSRSKVHQSLSIEPISQADIGLTATNYSARFSLNTWSPSQSIQQKIYSKTLSLQEDPEPILKILHDQEFRDVSEVHLSSIQSSTTTTSPPAEDSSLSPDRIIYIIIGTIVVFALGVMILGGCWKVMTKARQPSAVQLRDIDGDVMMTTKPVPLRSSPRSSSSRHYRSASAPTITQSPLHASQVGGSKSATLRHQDKEQYEDFADFASFRPERNVEKNPILFQQLSQNSHKRTSSSLTSSSTVTSSSQQQQRMRKEEVEDVFDFRFDDLLNDKPSSSKYSKGLSGNEVMEEDNTDYDLDGGDEEYSNRKKPSSSTFSFLSTFSSHGSKGGKKKSKDKVDYESLVL